MKRILAAMSGGVDSSVAAAILRDQGNDLTGVTMKLYDSGDSGQCNPYTCCSENDIRDAMAVCAVLGIPYSVCDFRVSFEKTVIEPFISQYLKGRTPNPCIECNRKLKFGVLVNKADELHCTHIATGHYARVREDPETGRIILLRSLSPEKDQSYVLYGLTQETLKRVLFPLGEMTKDQVRQKAAEYGFSLASKHDSQDLCFVDRNGYREFIEKHTGRTLSPGNFIDEEGHILGRHRGIGAYTIGQRKGLNISSSAPLYVKEIRTGSGDIVLSSEDRLYSDSCMVSDFNWISGTAPGSPVSCTVKTRYTARETKASLFPEEPYLKVVFDEPQRAVTPGQSLVAYSGDEVLGGGIIESSS
ncbi:MAG: tRNA 2-thiouridine(34) synthase MnmA [Lachnospiraceae bacterium]|nr:tRNA 2-thiouridine(34) synthase MnmA [Lachnospiraceae bacterium]